MTTVAEDLLNDFEDSGNEEEDEQRNGDLFADQGYSDVQNEGVEQADAVTSLQPSANGSMESDGDEEAPDEADIGGSAPTHIKQEVEEDAEETKARVEKMELKGVGDVRSVAGLMKTLQPVLDVSLPAHPRCLHIHLHPCEIQP